MSDKRHRTERANPSRRPSRLSEGSSARPIDYQLAYLGKQSQAEILAGPRANPDLCFSIVKKQNDTWRNRLYCGDNLGVLRALLDDLDVRHKVRLVYIDPPFATGGIFESRDGQRAYDDVAFGSHYLEFLRKRLILLRELLDRKGSIYLHLDGKMAFPAKIIMDEVFGPSNFRNWITRKKSNRKNFTRKQYGNISDYILFYSKSDEYIWNRPHEAWTDEWAKREYQYVDPHSGRRYKKVPVHAPGVRKGETGQPWRGKWPPPGKHWQYPPKVLDELDAKGEIYWSPTGNPRRKIYFDQSKGIPLQDIWLDCRDAHNQNIEVTGYPTEKPIEVLHRIVEASSNPGDLVLDCFAGSGTTLVTAEELDRRWIGVDSSAQAIATTVKRLAHGTEPIGDFVNGKKARDPSLFDPPHTLRTNFDLYLADGTTPNSPTAETLQKWQQLFSTDPASISP